MELCFILCKRYADVRGFFLLHRMVLVYPHHNLGCLIVVSSVTTLLPLRTFQVLLHQQSRRLRNLNVICTPDIGGVTTTPQSPHQMMRVLSQILRLHPDCRPELPHQIWKIMISTDITGTCDSLDVDLSDQGGSKA